jgi:hypothetical protein
MKTKATIAELRSVLQDHNLYHPYSLAPDWVILHLFERHCGLPQSRKGMPPVEKRSLAEIVHGKAPKRSAVTASAISAAEREQMKRQLEIASL